MLMFLSYFVGNKHNTTTLSKKEIMSFRCLIKTEILEVDLNSDLASVMG